MGDHGKADADFAKQEALEAVQPISVAETTIVLQTTTGQSCRSYNSYTSKS